MKNKRYIFFDLDGTITDPKVGITNSVNYALEYFDIKVKNIDDLCCFIGPPLKDSFMKYYGFDENKASIAISKYREYFEPYGIFENYLYSGIDDLLKNLRDKGKILVLATSKPAVFAKRILEHFQLDNYFDFVSGSELNGSRVKKSDVIAYALEENKITDCSEAVMIGDREFDILGANQFGIASVGVLYGYGSLEELNNAGADFIAKDIMELKNILL